MIVKVLMENRAKSEDFVTEHGLSMYIEASDRKILFDTGETDKFLINAEKMGVDLSQVDIVVISHGHYDHAGGVEAFIKVNAKAKVYMHGEAFIPHASRKDGELKDAGVDPELKDNERIILVNEDIFFDDDLILFSQIKSSKYVPEGNSRLLMKRDDDWVEDNFHHEQSLIIKEGKNRVLISGCSHRGIINILEQAMEYSDIPLTHVIGGFHLYDIKLDDPKDVEFISRISNELEAFNVKFYTVHCTGYDQFLWLKHRLGDRIEYISAGTILEI